MSLPTISVRNVSKKYRLGTVGMTTLRDELQRVWARFRRDDTALGVTAARDKFASKEDFYRFLDQDAEIARVAPDTIARVSQLTQKTNQFNLTTRRYTEQQISEIAGDPARRVYVVRVKDRLGDNGIVGVALTRDQEGRCEIENFLLSCRVIGRTVETAILAHIAQEARSRGNSMLSGWFLPRAKNAPAKDFYKAHGFSIAGERPEGTLWERQLSGPGLECPTWINLKIPQREVLA